MPNIPKLASAYKKIHPHWSWATAMRIAWQAYHLTHATK